MSKKYDSCGAQNKNYTVLFMLCCVAVKFKIKIEWFFPYSWAFLVEKQLRSKQTMLYPEEYDDIVKKTGTLHVLSNDFSWLNFQELCSLHTNKNKSFKISYARRIQISEHGKIGCSRYYASDPFCEHTLLKRGSKFDKIDMELMESNPSSHIFKNERCRKIIIITRI